MGPSTKLTKARDAILAIRQLREATGLTQRQLSQKTGIDQGQLCRIEGADDVRVSTLLDLLDSLGCELFLRPREQSQLAILIDQAMTEFGLACFDNVDTAALPRNEETARFVIRRLEHLGGRKGFMLASRIRRALNGADAHAA